MTIVQRRRLTWSGTLTVLLTLSASALDSAGYLTRLENFLYDERAAHCQRHMRPPTDRLVHLDIDDTAITQSNIGKWPWPRDVMADIVDEIHAAGPKVLAMDLLYAEPTPITYEKSGKAIDPDAVMTRSVRQFARVLLPVSLTFADRSAVPALNRFLTGMLVEHPGLTLEECAERVRREGLAQPGSDESFTRTFLSLRPQAIFERIHRELSRGEVGAAELKKRILPGNDPDSYSVLDRLFDEQFDRVLRERALARFSLTEPSGLPPVVRAADETTPILPLANAAAFSAFVDYLPESSDGTVRAVPLVVNYRGRLLPHMGLAVACAMLEVDVRDLRLRSNAVVIPLKDGREISIPVSTRGRTQMGRVGMLMQVPMFGARNSWRTMYDFPRHQKDAQHMSLYEVWRACQTRRRIAINESIADQALEKALRLADPNAADRYKASPLTGPARQKLIEETLSGLADSINGLASVADPGPEGKKLLADWTSCDRRLRMVQKQNDALQAQLVQMRGELRMKLAGRAVLIGGTATGIGDTKPTSLHYSAPGVVVHGAIVNAILTGNFWRMAPPGATLGATLAMGLLAGLLAATMSPVRGSIAVAGLVADYLAVNGYILFAGGNLIVGAAGPVFAAMLVGAAVALSEFITEAAERARITRRFRSYVDPALVNWVIDHPEQSRLDGEVREMTMVFTDLAGFTSMTERLGEKAVALLAEYMSHMVPAIRRNRGYIAKQMGDGLFFFFNAPQPDPRQAENAVTTVLEMRDALDVLNASLKNRGLPELGMRAGVSTGRVVIGDAGTADASDYTALGDSVNLAARLEAANKAFGTHTLIVARTVELLQDQFLVRPVANLTVAGKTQGVPVFEPICRRSAATPAQLQLAELTAPVVNAYRTGQFSLCLQVADQMDKAAGPSKLTALYRKLCQSHAAAPAGTFTGDVVLNEK
jgi:class 3 adenylate cyclase/CHASE2 domain-containing sensor protein